MTVHGGRRWAALLAGAVSLLAAAGSAAAQQLDQSEQEIERYRAMISDPMSNPGFLNVDRGEALWKLARGAKNVSLETCDLGEGPGKVDRAYARLPRYFKDADKVMDVEQRLLWCMQKIQELDTADVMRRRFSGPGRTSDLEDLTAFIANKSSGMTYDPQLSEPKEREMLALGEALFFYRAGASDFSCATCHAEPGKRIRLQGLPDFSKPGKQARETMGSWPTYRVSQSQLRTMQHRLWDCFRQARFPEPTFGADGITALTMYMVTMAKGGELLVPSIKR